MALFEDRRDAGRQLAQHLQHYKGQDDLLVLALPRGGVPVGYEVARLLQAPLDIFLVRKLGVPGHEELAMGAIASGGVRVLNRSVVTALNISKEMLEKVANAERSELERREQAYRAGRPALQAKDHTVILIDDGLATGASMQAAVAGLEAHEPASIVVAVPTASPETCEGFKDRVDEIVCAYTPEPFYGVGMWYENFEQTSDEEVQALLNEAARNFS